MDRRRSSARWTWLFACALVVNSSGCNQMPEDVALTKPTSSKRPAPAELHLQSGDAHYLVDTTLVSGIQPATGRMRGVSIRKGSLEPTTAPRNSVCGTTSNIDGKGHPWIVTFAKPSGRRGDRQMVAVGVDRMETAKPIPAIRRRISEQGYEVIPSAMPIPAIRRRISEQGYEVITSKRTDWKPDLTPEPPKEDILCDQFFAPKTQKVRWSGGTMLCDSSPRTNVDLETLSHECYIEIPMHGTTWMTEFYLREGDQPDDQVRYARRFIDSINLPDDANTPTTFSPRDPAKPDGSLDRYRRAGLGT